MKILLTGATGLSGAEVLKQALADPAIARVTVLTRRSTGVVHERLKEVVIDNFLGYPAGLDARIRDHDACLWCLGVSQNDVNQDEYIRITYDYTLYAAKYLFAVRPSLRFCFLSGQGADTSERTFTLFGRIKGRAEKELSKLSPNVFHFRPGYIQPSTPRAKPRWAEKIADPLAVVLNAVTDNFSVTSAQLARCMIGVAKDGAVEKLLDNREIKHWRK